jgi:hypothetical protein
MGTYKIGELPRHNHALGFFYWGRSLKITHEEINIFRGPVRSVV